MRRRDFIKAILRADARYMKELIATRRPKRPMPLLRQPLIQLLAINLAAGASVAVLMLGGLLALNPAGLRDLILADRAGGAALALLLFGFLITFGSAAMGTAIMALGAESGRHGRKAQTVEVYQGPND